MLTFTKLTWVQFQEEGNIFTDTGQEKLLSLYCFYVPCFQFFPPVKKMISLQIQKSYSFFQAHVFQQFLTSPAFQHPVSSIQLKTSSPVLSRQPHFTFFQLNLSQTRTSSLHGARQVQGVFFLTSGPVRSSQPPGLRDPICSSSEMCKLWAVVISPSSLTRLSTAAGFRPRPLSLRAELFPEQGPLFHCSASNRIWYSYPDMVIGTAVDQNVSLCPTALAMPARQRLICQISAEVSLLREAFLLAMFWHPEVSCTWQAMDGWMNERMNEQTTNNAHSSQNPP